MDKDTHRTDKGFYRAEKGDDSPSLSSYKGHDLTPDTAADSKIKRSVDVIEWEASEYIHHSKGAGWIFGLVFVTIILVALAIWMQVWTFAVLLVVMAVAIGVFAFRQPSVLRYKLSHDGLQVGDKFYSINDFRAFGILNDGAFYTIMLLPVKRFMPAVNIYFSEEQGEEIVDILGESLPLEKIEMDFVEKFMRRLRF